MTASVNSINQDATFSDYKVADISLAEWGKKRDHHS